ncbi:DUF4179 domain-containing protein [Paenibacillus sp. WC2504]|uniref:DUF4179 domain-containing protein n=1 Tax=Paenibacillus sp. WC2504 TaxID=3461403 RepID=UPI00404547DF
MNGSIDDLLKNSADLVNQKKLTLEKGYLKKTPGVRQLNKRLIALSLSMVICFFVITLAYSPQVLAYVANLLSLESLTKQIVEKGLSTPVGKGVSKQGISLNVENLYVDQNELVFDMVQSYTKDMEYKPALNSNDVQLYINGKKLESHSGGEFHTLQDGNYGGIVYYNVVYDNKLEQKMILPEEFQLTIKVNKIESFQDNWIIDIPVSRKLSDHATKTYEPIVSKKVDGVTITVSKVVFRPLSTYIEYEIAVPLNYSFTDNSSISNIQVKDDKGNTLGTGSIGGEEKKEGSMKMYRFTNEYHTPKELPDHLQIIPQRKIEEKRTDSVVYYRGEAIEKLIFNVPLIDNNK